MTPCSRRTLGIAIAVFIGTQVVPTTWRVGPGQPIRPPSTPASTSLPALHADTPPRDERLRPAINLDAAPPSLKSVLPSLECKVLRWRDYRPEVYVVRPEIAAPAVTFFVDTVKDEGRFTTWVGRSVIAGESFVAVATDAGLDAIVTIAGQPPTELHIRGDRVAIRPADSEQEARSCGVASVPSVTSRAGAAESFMPAAEPDVSDMVTDGEGNARSGVVILYDNLALAKANTDALDGNGFALIDATTKARIEAANVVLANSLIPVRWAYLGCFQCPDNGDVPLETMWGIARNPSTALGAFAVRKATEVGAVHVAVYTNPTDTQWTGFADIGGHFAVLRYGASYIIFAHEFGHNFGLNHDRYTMGALSPEHDGNYSYGIVFAARNIGNISPTANPIQQVGDVMSYCARRVPYFTTPLVAIDHYVFASTASFIALASGNIYVGPTANPAESAYIVDLENAVNVQPVGIPAGHRYACDGARTFRENAASIIATGWCIHPLITRQPGSVSVAAGQSFTLDVLAAGTGATFAYQWYKGAELLSGATAQSLTIANASNADAGLYHVVVTASVPSLGGTAVLESTQASVIITTAPSRTPDRNGGGGGAPSILFLAAGAALLSTRACRHRSRCDH